jgi:peptidase C25-like protein
VDQVLTVSNLAVNSSIPEELDVTLQGVTDGQPHSVSVVLNGASLGTMSFSSQSNVANTFSISPGLLQDGTNTVTLAALDGDNDISLVQSITLHFPHSYAADSNWLRASAPAGSHVQFTGFSNSQIQVFDITNPLAIEELSGPVVVGNSGSAITVTVPGGGTAAPHTLLALSSDQIAAPSGVLFHAASSLLQQRLGAGIIIITNPDFQSTLAPLVALRKSQNRDVAVVTTDQLYDAYNFGERTPFALRDYLQAASKVWSGKPESVLLVGDASLDPRNYLGFGDFDFVPTRIIETAAFKTASDDWLSDFAETGFATIPTGRIPARTAADASLVISKIVNYENGSTTGAWTQQALVIADQNVGVDFTAEANSAGLTLPASLTTTKILADGLDPATASQQIIAAINAGALIVNYTGHGSEQQWSFSDLLDNTSATALTNGNRLPVFLIMDCLNGFFHDVFEESLSSALLFAPNGGAVGVWASSGFTTAPPQASMDQALLSTLSANPSQTIGRAIITAKAGILDPDVRRTWNFFGDPGMRIAFPNTTAPSPVHHHTAAQEPAR